MSEEKLCINCKHYTSRFSVGSLGIVRECHLWGGIDINPITGKKTKKPVVPCSRMRSYTGSCGEAGKYWKAKDAPIAKQEKEPENDNTEKNGDNRVLEPNPRKPSFFKRIYLVLTTGEDING